ncbi:MAG: hypothetical protein JSR98_19110, partial [Proteobacteria bacterium]|nr:hypothetical protein [Pseudomonadota bacterium]
MLRRDIVIGDVRCVAQGCTISGVASVLEVATIPDEEAAERYAPVADFQAQGPSDVATHPFKRLLDVLIAGFALLLFLPLLAVVSGV